MPISAPTNLTTLKDNTDTTSAFTSGSLTFPPASLAIVCAGFSGPGANANTTAVTDSGSHTWTVETAKTSQGGDNSQANIAFCYLAAGATETVTVTPPGEVVERHIWIGYVSGSDPAPFDATGNSTGASTSGTATTSTNLVAANEIGFVVFHLVGNTGFTAWPTAGYTALTGTNITGGVMSDATRTRCTGFMYEIYSGGSGAAATSGTVAWASAAGDSGIIATFKPAVSTFVPQMGYQVF